MFDTVLHYFDETKNGNSTIKEVRFTNFDDETVYIFKQEFEKRFPQKNDEKKNETATAVGDKKEEKSGEVKQEGEKKQ